MANEVTKNPTFATDEQITQENARRWGAIQQFRMKGPEEIRASIQCALDPSLVKALTPPPGERLYVMERWLIRPEDWAEYQQLLNALKAVYASLSYSVAYGGNRPTKPLIETDERVKDIQGKLDAIYRRGADRLRTSVGRAADWACVPAEMLAAVLQNENPCATTELRRSIQDMERTFQGWIGVGSTGFGNLKPGTLERAETIFWDYYKRPVIPAGGLCSGTR